MGGTARMTASAPANRELRAVCLGGGHGLHATLEAMRLITNDVTAIVCVGDDGGSPGWLRWVFPACCRPVTSAAALSALAPETARRRGWSACCSTVSVPRASSTAIPWQSQSPPRSGSATTATCSPPSVSSSACSASTGTVIPGAAVPLDLSARVRADDGCFHRHQPAGVSPTAPAGSRISPSAPPTRLCSTRHLRPSPVPMSSRWARDRGSPPCSCI